MTDETVPTPAQDATTPVPADATTPMPAPATAPVPAREVPSPEPRHLRASTMLWGLVITLGGLAAISATAGYRLDLGLVAGIVLAAAGAALLLGAFVRAGRG